MPKQSIESPSVCSQQLELQVHRRGFHRIAGIDEVGRGPLAGPVVAAAVVLPMGIDLPGVRDSKLLSAAQRTACFDRIVSSALDIGIGCVEVAEIDRINILQASFLAMAQAIERLSTPPDYLLIDGPYRLPLPISQQGIPQGDRHCLAIASASIVAKVHRDRLMDGYHELYPSYGFDQHKGYGTAKHREALRLHGPCPIHRTSFRGVLR